MAKTLMVKFPEAANAQWLDLIGIGDFEDDATQFDGLQRLAEWARTSYAGTENRTHLSGTGPVCFAFRDTETEASPSLGCVCSHPRTWHGHGATQGVGTECLVGGCSCGTFRPKEIGEPA